MSALSFSYGSAAHDGAAVEEKTASDGGESESFYAHAAATRVKYSHTEHAQIQLQEGKTSVPLKETQTSKSQKRNWFIHWSIHWSADAAFKHKQIDSYRSATVRVHA
jgi:hypothetical protein